MADKKRPAATVLGSAKKRPSRQGNIFTLRLLAFAPGNIATVGSRSPSFDQIFIDLLKSVEVNDEGSWDESDAVALCSLAMFALFFLKTVFFIPKKKVTPTKDAAAAGSDDNDDDFCAEVEDVPSTPPHAMLPKLVNVVLSVENIFAFADHLDDEIEWIRPIARKFRSLTRGIISSSRAYAAMHVFEVLQSFADESTAMKDNVWMIESKLITSADVNVYFIDAPIVKKAQLEYDNSRAPSRVNSIATATRETTEELKEVKTALFTLAKMVSLDRSVHRIHRSDLSCPPLPTRRWRSSTRNSTRSCLPPPTRKVRAHHSSQSAICCAR
jgi:hypothetical protein